MLVGVIYERAHTRDLSKIWRSFHPKTPHYYSLMMVAGLPAWGCLVWPASGPSSSLSGAFAIVPYWAAFSAILAL
ncbi:MAG: hypothetical protein R3A44_39160 [Caldilineaceae bacterium]